MTIKMLLLLFLCATSVLAEPVYYLEMKQASTNLFAEHRLAFCRVQVVDQVEAEILREQYQNDPDYFLGLEMISILHVHTDLQHIPCVPVPLAGREILGKFIEIEEALDPIDARKYLPILFRIPVADQADAEKKLQKLEQNEFKGKQKTVKIKLGEA